MFAVHTRTSQLHYPGTQGCIWLKIKFPLAVIAKVCCRHGASLQAVGADDLSGDLMFHDQVIADGIELVGVHPSRVGRLQALIQLKVEDQEPKPQSGALIFTGGRQPHAVRTTPKYGFIERRWRKAGYLVLRDDVTCHGSLIRCDSATRWK